MYIDADTVITIAAVLGALLTIGGTLLAVYRWYLKQNKQSSDIEELRQKQDADIKAINAEQCLIIFGVLACLKGLKEQGCNGPVTKAIDKIERHINLQAHDQEE